MIRGLDLRQGEQVEVACVVSTAGKPGQTIEHDSCDQPNLKTQGRCVAVAGCGGLFSPRLVFLLVNSIPVAPGATGEQHGL